ncbi:MAG: Flp pilus assembly complex ATPase component TadA [Planctomycetes bacterium]|nr:Flp pilus assembly complex ATPase component TadA [Planctomycetota bacterium]
MAKELRNMRIGDLLLELGYVTSYQLSVALEEQRQNNLSLGRQLIKLGYITPDECLEAISQQTGLDYVLLEKIEIEPEVIAKLDYNNCDNYRVIPVREEEGVLYVAMANPYNVTILDDIRFVVEQSVAGLVADPDAIDKALNTYYQDATSSIDDMIASMEGEDLELVEGNTGNVEELAAMAESKPVAKLLMMLLRTAVNDRAADIHLEPYEDSFRIRNRVDGVLYELQSPPKTMAAALVARVKILSKLNISETRMPQDGKIPLVIDGRSVDLRVSIVPTKFGESAVIRILDRSVVDLDMHNLRLSDADSKSIMNLIHKPNGIVLVTGPTGSGKTTTLYACLNEINTPDNKIITNEDPVEYNIDGLIQVPIDPGVGLTYAKSLRATLRQDPDVILIGEIRDKETATIAIEASLTGHLVFSTLHTNDAPTTITRLTDMGIDNFLVTATLEAVIAQRLVRTICTHCKIAYTPTQESIMQLGIDPSGIDKEIRFYRGEGCDECRGTGFRGRVAIYEIMEMSPRLRDLILAGRSRQELQEAAIAGGMRTLREGGIERVFSGITTIEEVIKETAILD